MKYTHTTTHTGLVCSERNCQRIATIHTKGYLADGNFISWFYCIPCFPSQAIPQCSEPLATHILSQQSAQPNH